MPCALILFKGISNLKTTSIGSRAIARPSNIFGTNPSALAAVRLDARLQPASTRLSIDWNTVKVSFGDGTAPPYERFGQFGIATSFGMLLVPINGNAQTMGSAARRVAEYFGANAAINRSDAREKEWRGGLNDANCALRSGCQNRSAYIVGWTQSQRKAIRRGYMSASAHWTCASGFCSRGSQWLSLQHSVPR